MFDGTTANMAELLWKDNGNTAKELWNLLQLQLQWWMFWERMLELQSRWSRGSETTAVVVEG